MLAVGIGDVDQVEPLLEHRPDVILPAATRFGQVLRDQIGAIHLGLDRDRGAVVDLDDHRRCREIRSDRPAGDDVGIRAVDRADIGLGAGRRGRGRDRVRGFGIVGEGAAAQRRAVGEPCLDAVLAGRELIVQLHLPAALAARIILGGEIGAWLVALHDRNVGAVQPDRHFARRAVHLDGPAAQPAISQLVDHADESRLGLGRLGRRSARSRSLRIGDGGRRAGREGRTAEIFRHSVSTPTESAPHTLLPRRREGGWGPPRIGSSQSDAGRRPGFPVNRLSCR